MLSRILVVVACVWIAGVAYIAGQTWPVIPLDMPAGDPQIKASYDSALWRHIASYALLAIIPAAVLLGVSLILQRRRRHSA